MLYLFRLLKGPQNLLDHVQNECKNKTYIFNPLTKFLLLKYLAIDIAKLLMKDTTVMDSYPSLEEDVYYAATNLSYMAIFYNLQASDLASGILLRKDIGLNMTGFI